MVRRLELLPALRVGGGEESTRRARALARLLKKSKRAAEPVVIAHRKRHLTTTFWGKAWADNLERYADLANRLPRRRAYLRNGSVLDLAITRGSVEAYVRIARIRGKSANPTGS